MRNWVLKIELNGEWEECSFPTRGEALAAFTALAADYEMNLRRAVLLPAESDLDSPAVEPARKYIQ